MRHIRAHYLAGVFVIMYLIGLVQSPAVVWWETNLTVAVPPFSLHWDRFYASHQASAHAGADKGFSEGGGGGGGGG